MEFENYISSEIFQFVVGSGEEEKTYYLNKNFITKQSITLEALLCNGMRETFESKVYLKDVEPATFVRFAEFAVTGNYAIPQRPPSPTISTDLLVANLSTSTLDEIPSATAEAGKFPKGIMETTGQKLLHHAKVYVFADTYDIKPLKRKAFRSINNLLIMFPIDGAGNIAELATFVRYIYYNTMDYPTEQARAAVSHFCARNIRILISFNEFAKLQAEGGNFVVDLMNCVVRHESPGPLPAVRLRPIISSEPLEPSQPSIFT